MHGPMLNYRQAAELVGVPLGTMYAWVNRRQIPHVRLGGRLVRFRREALEAWLAEHDVPAAAKRDKRADS